MIRKRLANTVPGAKRFASEEGGMVLAWAADPGAAGESRVGGNCVFGKSSGDGIRFGSFTFAPGWQECVRIMPQTQHKVRTLLRVPFLQILQNRCLQEWRPFRISIELSYSSKSSCPPE